MAIWSLNRVCGLSGCWLAGWLANYSHYSHIPMGKKVMRGDTHQDGADAALQGKLYGYTVYI
jgi:hypothetical protein